jgi:hypothetical protein
MKPGIVLRNNAGDSYAWVDTFFFIWFFIDSAANGSSLKADLLFVKDTIFYDDIPSMLQFGVFWCFNEVWNF